MEQERVKKRSELLAQEEEGQEKGSFQIRRHVKRARGSLIDFTTPWKNLFETPKTEYDEALEKAEDTPGKKYYW